MDIAVTVRAAPVKEENRSPPSWSDGVTGRRHMTLRADPRIGNFEKPVIDRTMRLVAGGAVLYGWRMLPEKRSAPLGMAGIAVFVNACLLELGRIGRPVRVVAIGTGEFPFSERHMGGAHELRRSLQMALAANFRLGALVGEDGLVADLGKLEAVGGLLHDGMTVDATDSTSGMRACLPVGLNSLLMALEAGLVLRLG